MDVERAKQIIESHGVIEVLHDGLPVWIENVRDDKAEVTYLGSRRRAEVPLSSLIES